MSASNKFKKLSVVAVGAALSLASVNVAKGVSTNYYRTGFEATPNTTSVYPWPDNPAVGYTAGPLLGQNGWSDANPGGSAGTPSVVPASNSNNVLPQNGSQIVSMTAQNGAGGGNYADVYTTQANLTASQVATFGNVVNVSFDLQRQGTGTRASAFGVEILSKNQDAVLASLFLGNTNDNTPAMLVEDANNAPNIYAGFGRNDGNWGSYHIQMDFNTKTFTVFVDGNVTNASFAMNAAAIAALSSEGNAIGAVAFSNTNNGTDTAFYDNLQVVPEPGGIAMVSCGALLLISKRPKRAGA